MKKSAILMVYIDYMLKGQHLGYTELKILNVTSFLFTLLIWLLGGELKEALTYFHWAGCSSQPSEGTGSPVRAQQAASEGTRVHLVG